MPGMRFFRNKDICVRLEGDSIKGANSFSFDSAYSAPKIEVIGKGSTRKYQGKNEADGSISALILDAGSDLYSRFMSTSGFITGGFLGATDNSITQKPTAGFGFNSGYVNNYTLNGGVNSPPSDSIDFVVYGEISGATGPSPKQDNIGITGIRNKSIIISGPHILESEFIQSFSYSISTNWQPSYVMGTHFPIDVSKTEGYTVSLDLDIIAGTGQRQDVFNNFEESFISGASDIEIRITGCNDNPIIYKMPRARIESEQLNSSVDGFLEGNISFQTVVNTLEELQ